VALATLLALLVPAATAQAISGASIGADV